MNVGILLITHEKFGSVLLQTAQTLLGHSPLMTEVVEVPCDADPELKLNEARNRIEKLNQGDGVLILTDMFGATPANIASKLANGTNIQVVSGVNLPMLFKIFNYPKLDLDTLLEKAIAGGQSGVMLCNSPPIKL